MHFAVNSSNPVPCLTCLRTALGSIQRDRLWTILQVYDVSGEVAPYFKCLSSFKLIKRALSVFSYLGDKSRLPLTRVPRDETFQCSVIFGTPSPNSSLFGWKKGLCGFPCTTLQPVLWRITNPSPASRLLLFRPGQCCSTPSIVLPSGGVAAKHRKRVTTRLFIHFSFVRVFWLCTVRFAYEVRSGGCRSGFTGHVFAVDLTYPDFYD
ncbi:hypothetical protein CSKR_102138 [Clonorchis sinensis]|uniref:Uncharacterized protein n=1 Tax=Clonorchis sinensis TaxID=79923 RepID=A0A419Q9X0_CLOSI|nr:hypothetical protein CSKR_102138 [Clonorchis sinensis]